MRYAEATKLKKGDLVIVDGRSRQYGGLIFEVESINKEEYGNWCYRVDLKQPGFDTSFRIKNYDSRHLKIYEP